VTVPNPHTPSVPLSPEVVAEGESRSPRSVPPRTDTETGADVPEGGAANQGRSRPPGASTEGLSGKAFRDALKAAESARAKGQRQQRARPWSKRDPYRRAVPGGRKPPPKDVA
jgi:hypothetical protein